MSHGDASTNGDNNIVTLEREAKTPPAAFYLDDAFSDGDEPEMPFEFSSATIRAELGNSLSPPYDVEGAEDDWVKEKHSSRITDASVSTLDINGLEERSPSQSTTYFTFPNSRSPSAAHSSPPAIDSRQLSSQFDQISLNSPHLERAEERIHEESPVEENTITVMDEYSSSSDDTVPQDVHDREEHDPEANTYPTVHIDASVSFPVVVEVTPSSRPTSPAVHLDARARASQENPSVLSPSEPNPKSVSTPSLPMHSPSSSLASATLPRPSSGHRPTRSTGPSMFERVVSKTRPTFLPPKSREEDKKHMADWEKMMRRSRVAEEKRRKALNERRLVRELRVEESLHIWEHEILPDWRVVNKNPALRRLWWAGIPTKLRATMWERAVGNSLALSKDTYRTCLARAKRALAAGTFPTTTISLIEDDVLNTLPSLHIFHPETGPMYQDLKDMLYAWVVARSDEGLGYVPGVARIAAMIVLNMPPVQGFITMRNLLERHCMRSFYGGLATKDDVEAYYRIFDTLLADGMPKIYFNFKQHQISPSAYLPDWLIPIFLDHLPFEACARIWDVILLEGDSFLYRASLAALAVLEPRLFFPDKQELMDLLRGENKAALEVARRDGVPLNGGKYEIYGVDEETLWDRIGAMDDWWKESTWTRLLTRELPDL